MTSTPENELPGTPTTPTTPYNPAAAAGDAQAAGANGAPYAPQAPEPATPSPQETTPLPSGQVPSAHSGGGYPDYSRGGYQAPAQSGYPTANVTAPLPSAGGAGYGAQPPMQPPHQGDAFGAAQPQPQQPVQTETSAHPKSRTGALIAGLAIGALLGGAVGGGVAAVVSSNHASSSSAQGSGNTNVTIKNPENATAISAVASVATPSVVTLEVSSSSASGSGSGVIYRKDGYIVTNAHVVTLDGAAEDATVRVKLSDGSILDGDVVGIDPYADLAVVKVEADDLQPIEFADSDKIDVGDLTVAIGAPLNLANTVTSGVVSALNRGISVGSPLIPQDPSDESQDGQAPDDNGDQGNGDQGNGDSGENGFPWDFRFGLPGEGDDSQGGQSDGGQGSEGDSTQEQSSSTGSVTLPVIQTDASINPGNSGGALLNGEGKLMGINVAIASAVTSEDGSAGSNGLGFAIPSNLVSRVADAIIDGEQPSHGLLGASVADSSQDTDEDANHAGGLLAEVQEGGAADKAGLKAGDVITAVDGVSAVDGTSVSALIRVHEGGSKISIEYTRGGKAAETEATLGTLEW